ncbi:hypothetical protein [Leifsonia xyli]|nr:hypothetical protein [Leifsonia xyli]
MEKSRTKNSSWAVTPNSAPPGRSARRTVWWPEAAGLVATMTVTV